MWTRRQLAPCCCFSITEEQSSSGLHLTPVWLCPLVLRVSPSPSGEKDALTRQALLSPCPGGGWIHLPRHVGPRALPLLHAACDGQARTQGSVCGSYDKQQLSSVLTVLYVWICLYASKNSLPQTRRVVEKCWVMCRCQVLVPSYLLRLKGVRGDILLSWSMILSLPLILA